MVDCTADTPAVQRISLLDSLGGEWLKLPLAIMQDVGPAVQTMGGLLKLTNKETFASVETIAQRVRAPVPTVRKHLATLNERGWIDNCGREYTRRGAPRRTATIKLTKQTIDHLDPYGILPWWACCSIRKVGKLPWCARALLAIVMGRLCALKAGAERDGPDDGLEGMIENMGGAERFRFSLCCLARDTGLTRDSLALAKRRLHKLGIVRWSGEENAVDCLAPNWEFAVIQTPATPSHVYVAFGRVEG